MILRMHHVIFRNINHHELHLHYCSILTLFFQFITSLNFCCVSISRKLYLVQKQTRGNGGSCGTADFGVFVHSMALSACAFALEILNELFWWSWSRKCLEKMRRAFWLMKQYLQAESVGRVDWRRPVRWRESLVASGRCCLEYWRTGDGILRRSPLTGDLKALCLYLEIHRYCTSTVSNIVQPLQMWPVRRSLTTTSHVESPLSNLLLQLLHRNEIKSRLDDYKRRQVSSYKTIL